MYHRSIALSRGIISAEPMLNLSAISSREGINSLLLGDLPEAQQGIIERTGPCRPIFRILLDLGPKAFDLGFFATRVLWASILLGVLYARTWF